MASLIQPLTRHPFWWMLSVSVLLIVGFGWYHFDRHFQRQSLLRPKSSTNYVETRQEIPEWIRHYGLSDYVPSTSYQQATGVLSLSDEQSQQIADNFELSGVQVLEFVGQDITDNSLPLIRASTELSQLFIRDTSVTPAGFTQLVDYENSPNWYEINIRGAKWEAPLFRHLEKFKDIHRLVFSRCNLSDKELQQFSQFPHLRELSLGECPQLTDKGLAAISDLQGLESLSLFYVDLSASTLQNWKLPSNLNQLAIRNTVTVPLPDEFLQTLMQTTGITSLRLDGIAIDESAALRLLDLPNLDNSLSLPNYVPSPQFIEKWSRSKVDRITLSADLITPDIVVALNSAVTGSGKELVLHFSALTDPAKNYDHLRELEDVEYMVFDRVTLTDRHIELLTKIDPFGIQMWNVELKKIRLDWIDECDGLVALTIYNTPLTKSDVGQIATLTLEALVLDDCELTDKSLSTLSKMKRPPEVIRIQGNNISGPDLQRLIDDFRTTKFLF